MEKSTSSLVTLMRKVTKNPRLLGSWEDFKAIFLTWTSWRALGNL